MTEKTPSKICLDLTSGKFNLADIARKCGRTHQVMSAMAKNFPEQFRLICLGAMYELENKNGNEK